MRAPVLKAGWEMPVGILGTGTETKPCLWLLGVCTPAMICSRPCPPWISVSRGDLCLQGAYGWRLACTVLLFTHWWEGGGSLQNTTFHLQHFIRVHSTFKLFHGSKFNSCCQDCLLWAGDNWQYLFSFLTNKIICIFPAEEKRCGYSFGTSDCLAHKSCLGSTSQEKPSKHVAKKTTTHVFICHGTVWQIGESVYL